MEKTWKYSVINLNKVLLFKIINLITYNKNKSLINYQFLLLHSFIFINNVINFFKRIQYYFKIFNR